MSNDHADQNPDQMPDPRPQARPQAQPQSQVRKIRLSLVPQDGCVTDVILTKGVSVAPVIGGKEGAVVAFDGDELKFVRELAHVTHPTLVKYSVEKVNKDGTLDGKHVLVPVDQYTVWLAPG